MGCPNSPSANATITVNIFAIFLFKDGNQFMQKLPCFGQSVFQLPDSLFKRFRPSPLVRYLALLH